MKKLALFLVTAVVLAGCGNASSSPAVVKTVTATATVTETSDPVVQTVTKPKTPQACLDVIDDAEGISKIVVQFSKTMSTYPQMVGDAFQAGLQSNQVLAQDVLDRMSHNTAETKRETALMSAAVNQFNADKTVCRRSK